MIIPISKDINKFYVNINGTSYPVKKMLFNGDGVQNVEVYRDYYSQYLTIESLEDANEVSFDGTQEYFASTDSGLTWTSYTAASSWTIDTGEKVMFKATVSGTPWGSSWGGTFSSTKTFNAYGNVMSMYFGDNFEGQYGGRSFSSMFKNCTGLVDASHLMLPSTTLTYDSYAEMFSGCTSLVNAPQLPATTLYDRCYTRMFANCTSLVNAPVLPATTLVDWCYNGMFSGCTSLVNAPQLPATTLAWGCYSAMFSDCTSLANPPVLPAATLANSCYNSMFMKCRALTEAPALPATTLVDQCYQYMFNGCTNLNKVICLATTISSSNATQLWISTSNTGTFYKDSTMTSWPSGASGIPTNWTTNNYN